MRPLLCAALAVTAALPASAASFATFDQGALARAFALPALGETRLVDARRAQLRATLDLTSEYVALRQGDEELLEDGEAVRFALQYRRGLPAGFEWGVEVPLLHVGGGFMDGFIENWHDWFGLPNGGRELAAQDQYEYRYTDGGTTLFRETQEGTTLGDVLLLGGWQWRDGMALRAELKLPTGDEETLTGGNAGGALWADAALPFGADAAVSAFLSGGVSLNARGRLLADRQETVVPFGGAGLAWRALDALDLGVQVDAHGRLYEGGEMDAFRRPGVQLVFGGAWHAVGARFDLAFQEDIVTHSSPDFSIHMGLTLAPR